MNLLEPKSAHELAALALASVFSAPVHCPYCDAVCCYLRNELLYEVQGDDAGPPLSATTNAIVTVRCPDRHRKGAWAISGHAVAENIEHGRHPLPMR